MANVVLKPITDGAVTGTGTLTLTGDFFGGCILNADGTNTGTITVQNDTSGGDTIFELSSSITTPAFGPFKQTTNTKTIYYSISGTGADAQLYEWVFIKPGSF